MHCGVFAKGKFERDQGAPRVTDDDGFLKAELHNRLVQMLGLGTGCPEPIARTLTVTEAWPIERYDAIVPGQPIDQATGHEVLESNSIAVQKYDGHPATTIEIVHPHAVDVEECTLGRLVLLCAPRLVSNPARSRGKDDSITPLPRGEN